MADRIVSLTEIPYDWLAPGTYLEARPNYQRVGLLPYPARALLHVPIAATGSAVAGAISQITRPEQSDALLGIGSIGAAMTRAFLAANRTSPLYLIGVAEQVAWTAATATVTFGGAGRGDVPLYIAGKRVAATMGAGMTPTQMASAMATAINQRTDLVVTATSAAAVLTLTAKNKGAIGNEIDIRVGYYADEVLPAGITAAIAPMAGGTGDADVQTAVLDLIADEWFTDMVSPYTSGAQLSAYELDLATRFKAMGKRDATLWIGARGTFGELAAKSALINSPHISLIGVDKSPTPAWEWAASMAGVAMFNLTNDPARQLRSLILPGMLPPAVTARWTDTERDLLLKQGISTYTSVGDDTVVLDRVVTSYKKTNLNVPDRAWLDVMVPRTVSRIRYDWSAYVSALYPRHKLASDESVAAHNSDSVVTPGRMAGSWAARCKVYEREGWIEDVARTIAESQFGVDPNDRNRLQARQQIQIIGNLMVLAGALEFQV